MLISTSLRTLMLIFSYCVRLLFYTWIKFLLLHLLLAKDCFEILLLVSSRWKGRIIWIVKELCVDHLWRDLLEKDQSETFHPIVFQSNKCDVYMCQSCRNLNKLVLPGKNYNLKTPMRKSLSDSTNVRESMNLNRIVSSRVFNKRKGNDESPETLNTSLKGKTSAFNQCEPSYTLNNQALFRGSNGQSCSKNINKVKVVEHGNILKEASTSPLNYQGATPVSVKHVNKIYDAGANSETPKSNSKTPRNSRDRVMSIPSTPANELSSFPRRSRLELMFSNEDHFSDVSPEKESLFVRNWNKLKHFTKIDRINFKKRINGENEQTHSSQTTAQIESSKSETPEGRNIVLITMQTPEMNSCCDTLLCRIKTKFNQNAKESSVAYKKF